jgi:hypothetical protein
MDLLALIAAEPTLLPLWAVLAFAAGMYPMMLFSCTPCCACSLCTEGTLPDTLTVTFSGLPETSPGPDLISLSVSSCFGSGASGRVTAPGQSVVGGDPADDRGPITAVEVTSGGSGYAKFGRVAPTLTASGGSGTGATFTVTLANATDACNVDYWKVSKVTQTGGSGYVDGDELTITVSEGDTATADAVVRLGEQREPPTLTASVSGGTGASLTVSIAENAGSPKTWRVSGITVGSGGSGYTDLAYVTITAATEDTTQAAAAAQIQTNRVAPTVSVVEWTVAGSGAVVTVTLAETPNWQGSGRSVWRVTAFTVVDGGSGYVEGDSFEAAVTDGVVMPGEDAICLVSSVDETGAVLAVELLEQGAYYKQGSSIEQVSVSYGGTYWRTDGANGWNVRNGGIYYREDASVAPYVADVTVTVTDAPPSAGAGASLSVEIDEDTASETFGQVVSLSIDNGGDGYLAHETFESCLNRFNGRSIVVRRLYSYWSIYPFFPNPQWPFDKCIYGYTCAPIDDCSLDAEAVMVEYRGNGDPYLQLSGGWRVGLYLHQRGQVNTPLGGGYFYPAAYGNFVAPESVQNCSYIDITANGLPDSNTDGATAHIQGGGEYEEVDACKRISAEDMDAIFTEVTWGDFYSSSADSGSGCGWTSSVVIGGGTMDDTGQWCQEWKDSLQSRADHWIDTFNERGGEGFVGGPAFGVNGICSQSISFGTLGAGQLPIGPLGGFSIGIRRVKGCGWEWSKSQYIEVSVVRSFSWTFSTWNINGGAVSWPSGASRTCRWYYPVLSIPPVDEDGIPSGQVELGEPTLFTNRYLPFGADDDFENEWLDDLLTESSVCANFPKPTITISRLP